MDGVPKTGLRERKKAKTRSLIQAHAVRLFIEQGYDETSIEQIAEAAEVSPSTVFRYFPTKPDLVLYDDLDARMFAGFRRQPPELSAVQALRATFGAFFPAEGAELAVQQDREQLVRAVPELRATVLDTFAHTLEDLAHLIAERAGRPADDDEVLALTGSVIGIAIAAWLSADTGDWIRNFLRRLDAGLALLETGFHL